MLPVHWAASDGKVSSIRFFLDKRLDINAQDSNGCTPVIIATQHEMTNCIIYLIKNGADLTIRDTNGDTALHWAAYRGHAESLGLLAFALPHCVNLEDNFGQVL